ncbi:GP5 protein [RtEi arterivirus]|uniref:GP5 protein n=1 Tax=RtEi arterivirus TaxID=2847273 RepID=A0A2H4MWP7_9NIDO|nr:GP5 protein [Rodent arterivirus]ATP66641.1 GP5 protein [RtEi arterivirus]
MKCYRSSAASVMRAFYWCLPFFLYIGWCCPCASASNGTGSTMQLIYNMTLCELNGTDWLVDKFDWAVESFVLFPVFTHIVSRGFMTTSHLLDWIALTTIATAGYYHSRYVLSSIYAVCAFAAFVCFLVRFIKNCMSWRYSCTRYTNFILDTKGRLFRWNSPIIIEKQGKADVDGQLVDIKHVVIQGTKAKPLTRVAAEQWGSG